MPVKLLLIGLIPLALLIYTSLQIYADKNQKVKLLASFIERIHQSANINTLIDYLEKERKFSFDYAMKKNQREELIMQRPRTDSAIQQLEASNLQGFKTYTFLEKLHDIRGYIDSGYLPPEQVMHYYTTAIFRINTLNSVSFGTEIYLEQVHKDLVGQKLLSEMITNLGIMRSNIYNSLYTKKYLVETLVGMIGVHDVYKTYETEFLLRSSPFAAEAYKKISANTALTPTIAYIDTLFKRFKPDSSYTADNWWKVSNDGMTALMDLRQTLWDRVTAGTSNILKQEKTVMSRTIIFLVLGLLFVIGIVIYIVYSITSSLTEMKVAAQKISEGASDLRLQNNSNDVIGHLAESILKIDANNKSLAEAADAIGKGNFSTPIKPRGSDDILGNAIIRMRDNMVENIRVINYSNEQLHQLAEKYQTIFYKSPLPKWIYDFETLRFLDVNEAAIHHYGYSREEFLAMTIADIRPQGDRENFLRHMNELKNNPEADEKFWHHLKKNGELIAVEVTAHFIDYNNKKARIAIVLDITEKLKTEQNLVYSEERFRSIIEQFPYPVINYDPDGNCTAANKAWETMWQDKRENVKDYNIRKDPQMIASGLSRYVEKAFSGETSVSEPYLYDPALIGQKGRKRWMVMTLYPLKDADGGLREVVLILQDITERKNAEEVLRISEEKLKESHEELRQLTSHLQNIREEERASIAREVHDELGQQITCIKMDVHWLLKRIKTEDAQEQEKIKAIPELLDHTAQTVRKIATELRPSILDDFGLIDALEWQSGEFEKRSGINIQFHSTVPAITIGKSISTSLFRIYQESLTNVARHAAATKIEAAIALQDDQLVLTITDNGKGFDVTRIGNKKTLGLLGMRERTLMFGGKYEITSMPGKGTTITAKVPLQVKEKTN